MHSGQFVSCFFIPNSTGLPSFYDLEENEEKKDKSYKVPANFELESIASYLFDDLKVKEYLLLESDKNEPTDYLDLAIELPEHYSSEPYIILD